MGQPVPIRSSWAAIAACDLRSARSIALSSPLKGASSGLICARLPKTTTLDSAGSVSFLAIATPCLVTPLDCCTHKLLQLGDS